MNAYFHRGSIVVADERPKEVIRRLDDGAPGSAPQGSAEAKRLEARRRFLLGGAAAIPVLVTANRAKAVGVSTCLSQLGLQLPFQGFSIPIEDCNLGNMQNL